MTPRDLEGCPLITVTKGTSARNQIDRWFAEQAEPFPERQILIAVSDSAFLTDLCREFMEGLEEKDG